MSCLRHYLTFIRDRHSVAFPGPGKVLSWLDKEPRDLAVSISPELRLPLYTTLPGSFNVSSGQVLYGLSFPANILNTISSEGRLTAIKDSGKYFWYLKENYDKS